MDIIFVKVGKAIDWFENDSSTPEGQNYMDTVVEPFLDLSVSTKTDTKTARTKLRFQDGNGKKYEANIKDLVSGGVKVYYEDSDVQPNLTPFIPERVEGMAQGLFSVIDEFMYDRQQATQPQTTGE